MYTKKYNKKFRGGERCYLEVIPLSKTVQPKAR